MNAAIGPNETPPEMQVIINVQIPLGATEQLDLSKMQPTVDTGNPDHKVGRVLFALVDIDEKNTQRRYLRTQITLFDTTHAQNLLSHLDGCVANIHVLEQNSKNERVVRSLSCGLYSSGFVCKVGIFSDGR